MPCSIHFQCKWEKAWGVLSYFNDKNMEGKAGSHIQRLLVSLLSSLRLKILEFNSFHQIMIRLQKLMYMSSSGFIFLVLHTPFTFQSISVWPFIFFLPFFDFVNTGTTWSNDSSPFWIVWVQLVSTILVCLRVILENVYNIFNI